MNDKKLKIVKKLLKLTIEQRIATGEHIELLKKMIKLNEKIIEELKNE